jgi:hypothetical protein
MMQLEGFRADHACQIAQVSRAGFYRHYTEHEPRQADVAVRDLIQRIVLENRCYGYRRVTAELGRRGVVVNHKRVLRLMRLDNLLAVRKRRFVFTTDSRHTYAVYPNLAARLVTLTAVNQLWVADITYVRLRETFLYLAIVLDAYSRRVIGWELGEDLSADLALGALNRALADRAIAPEEVYLRQYREVAPIHQITPACTPRSVTCPRRVRARLARTKQKGGRCAAASLMSFLRHGEIYHFDEGAIPCGPRPRSSKR